jgi:hypothetical protein
LGPDIARSLARTCFWRCSSIIAWFLRNASSACFFRSVISSWSSLMGLMAPRGFMPPRGPPTMPMAGSLAIPMPGRSSPFASRFSFLAVFSFFSFFSFFFFLILTTSAIPSSSPTACSGTIVASTTGSAASASGIFSSASSPLSAPFTSSSSSSCASEASAKEESARADV